MKEDKLETWLTIGIILFMLLIGVALFLLTEL